MAELAFDVKANYDEVIRLREELEQLREEMLKTDTATEEQREQMALLEKQYAETSSKLGNLVDDASEKAAKMGENYALGLSKSSTEYKTMIDALKGAEDGVKSFMREKQRSGELDEDTAKKLRVLIYALQGVQTVLKTVSSAQARAASETRAATTATKTGTQAAKAKEEATKRAQRATILATAEERKAALQAEAKARADADLARHEEILAEHERTQANILKQNTVLQGKNTAAKAAASATTTGLAASETGATVATTGLSVSEGVATGTTLGFAASIRSLNAAMAANPIGLALTLLPIATSLIGGAGDETDETTREVKELNKETKKELDNLEQLFGTLENCNRRTNAYKDAVDEVNEMCKEYNITLLGENSTLEQQRIKYQQLEVAIRAANAAKLGETYIDKAKNTADNKNNKALKALKTNIKTTSGVSKGVKKAPDEVWELLALQAGMGAEELATLEGVEYSQKFNEVLGKMQDVLLKNSEKQEDRWLTSNNLKSYLNTVVSNQKALNQRSAEIKETMDGFVNKASVPDVDVTTASFNELEAELGRVLDDLADEKKAEQKATNEVKRASIETAMQAKVIEGTRKELKERKSRLEKQIDEAEEGSEEQKRLEGLLKSVDKELKMRTKGDEPGGGGKKSNDDDKEKREREQRLKARVTAYERYESDITRLIQQVEGNIEKEEIDAIKDHSMAVEAQLDLERKSLMQKAEEVGNAMTDLFEGNVDLLHREKIPEMHLADAGWDIGVDVARIDELDAQINQLKRDAKSVTEEIAKLPDVMEHPEVQETLDALIAREDELKAKIAEFTAEMESLIPDGYATLYSMQEGITDSKGEVHEILFTPILPDGTVLSPEYLKDYIHNTLEGAEDFLAADNRENGGLGIVIGVDVDEQDGQKLHEMQEAYYELLRLIKEYDALKRKNAETDRLEKEQDAMNAFLKKYGSYEEQKYAITKEYEKKIANAQTEGERLSLGKERDSALHQLALSFNEDYDLIFANAKSLSDTMLADAIDATQEAIKKAKSSGDIQALSKLYERLQAQMTEQRGRERGWGWNAMAEGAKLKVGAEDKRYIIGNMEQTIREREEDIKRMMEAAPVDQEAVASLKAQIKAYHETVEQLKTENENISESIRFTSQAIAEGEEDIQKMTVSGDDPRNIEATAYEVGLFKDGLAELNQELAENEEKSAAAEAALKSLLSQLVALELAGASPEDIEAARAEIAELRAEVARLKAEAIQDDQDALAWLKEGAVEVLAVFGQLGKAMSSFRNGKGEWEDTIAEIGDGLSGLASHAGDLQKAFSGEYAQNKGQAIATAIQGTIELIAMVGTQIAKNKRAQEEWNRTIEESAHRYTMLKLEKMDYEESNIFGVEDPFKRATTGATQYMKSMEEITKLTDKLGGGKVQTGTKKGVDWGNVGKGVGTGAAVGAAIGTAVGGWAAGLGTVIGTAIGAVVGGIAGLLSTKVVPVFESLADHYEYLFDEETYELNPQLIADYDKLDEDTKQIVDHWDEIKEKAESARNELKDNLKDFTGDLGKQLEDTLVNAWKNHRLYSAVDDYKRYVGQQIASILEQQAFSAVFENLFTDLGKRMEESFLGPNADNSIIDDLDEFNQQFPQYLEAYGMLMDQLDEQMQEMGYDGLRDRQKNADATTQTYQQISETTGSAIQGGVTALRLSSEVRNQHLSIMNEHLTEMLLQQLRATTLAEDIRGIQADCYLALVAIRDNTAGNLRAVQNIEGLVDRIEKNTREL